MPATPPFFGRIGKSGWVSLAVGAALLLSTGASAGLRASANKQIVQRYMAAFNRTDHAAILACLTEDVEWVIPGAVHLRGKAAFDKEIENDAFVGKPEIRVTRLTEERNVVIAEGSVRSMRKDGNPLNLVFCDVFVMKGGKIRKLTSYLVEVRK